METLSSIEAASGPFRACAAPEVNVAEFGLTKLAYTIDDLIQLTTLGRNSIYSAVARGELVASKLGRRTFFTAPEIARWLLSLRCLVKSPGSEEGGAHDSKETPSVKRRRGRPRKNPR